MQQDSKRLEPLLDDAIKSLRTVFRGDRKDEDIAVARIAASVIATHSRLRQSERAEQGLLFNMAQALAEDKEQLAQYLRATVPEMPMVKKVEVKKVPASTK